MATRNVILYVRGIETVADHDRARGIIAKISGVDQVAFLEVPGQDGSAALSDRLAITYQGGETTPELMIAELDDAGYRVVTQEDPGEIPTAQNPLDDLKTSSHETREYHATGNTLPDPWHGENAATG